MAYITFDDINKIRKSEALTNDQRLAEGRGQKIFLSHSSKDDLYVRGVSDFLREHGGVVYADNGDKRLPENPSAETAEILRSELRRSGRLVIMMSENSSRSGWIPWELGMGDGHKGVGNVALLPMGRSSTEEAWARREYLGLYPVIRFIRVTGYSGKQWVVDPEPSGTRSVTLLKNWLKL